MSDSEIHINSKRQITAYVGADATNLVRAKLLRASLQMMARTNGKLIPTRGFTWKKGLAAATSYTRKPYQGKKSAPQAIEDLKLWITAMEAALPVVEEGKG